MSGTKQNKQQRFMELYQPLNARLCRFVQTLVWDKEDAKDVVSDTILIAFENLEKLKDETAFLSYLFSVASNIVNTKIRRKKYWGWFDMQKAEQITDNTNTENQLLLYELNKALQKLPNKQRDALVWFEISGLTMEQIAALQKTSIGGVKSNIHRARITLNNLLKTETTSTINQLKGVWYE